VRAGSAQVGDDLFDTVLVDDTQALVRDAQTYVGRKRRRVLFFAWETLLPLIGRFPVTWQTLDMTLSL
jgi:hypothetical protein